MVKLRIAADVSDNLIGWSRENVNVPVKRPND
jgi:hypothetical protein